MTDKKAIFTAFTMEDSKQRDFLHGQALNTASTFEYIDVSVKQPYQTEWKKKVRARIKRSHGLIALISKESLTSEGQRCEIKCAREEDISIPAIWAYRNDRTSIRGFTVRPWKGKTIEVFTDTI